MTRKILSIFAIIVIGVTSFVLLTGGTYFYQKFIYSNPLEKELGKIEGLEVMRFEQSKNNLLLEVKFNSEEKLRQNFYLLLDQLQGQKKNDLNNCTLMLKNTSNNKEFANFLRAAKLPIYEAISTGHFTALPEQLTLLSEKEKISYNLEIDNQFIFVIAHQGKDFAYLIINSKELPFRVITTMGEEYL